MNGNEFATKDALGYMEETLTRQLNIIKQWEDLINDYKRGQQALEILRDYRRRTITAKILDEKAKELVGM